jgi:hypothetical protein
MNGDAPGVKLRLPKREERQSAAYQHSAPAGCPKLIGKFSRVWFFPPNGGPGRITQVSNFNGLLFQTCQNAPLYPFASFRLSQTVPRGDCGSSGSWTDNNLVIMASVADRLYERQA